MIFQKRLWFLELFITFWSKIKIINSIPLVINKNMFKKPTILPTQRTKLNLKNNPFFCQKWLFMLKMPSKKISICSKKKFECQQLFSIEKVPVRTMSKNRDKKGTLLTAVSCKRKMSLAFLFFKARNWKLVRLFFNKKLPWGKKKGGGE